MWCTLHIMCICWTTFYNIYGLLNLVFPQNLPALCITILLLPYAFYMQQCYYHSAHLISAQHVTISNAHTTATTNTTISNAYVTIRNVCVSIITMHVTLRNECITISKRTFRLRYSLHTFMVTPGNDVMPHMLVTTYIHAYIMKASTDFGSVCNI